MQFLFASAETRAESLAEDNSQLKSQNRLEARQHHSALVEQGLRGLRKGQPFDSRCRHSRPLYKSSGRIGTTYNSLGRLYRAHGQPAATLEFQLKALKIHETLNRPRMLIQSLNAVAVAFQVSDKDDQAREYYERARAPPSARAWRATSTSSRRTLAGF